MLSTLAGLIRGSRETDRLIPNSPDLHIMSPNAKPEEPNAVADRLHELREGAEAKGDCGNPTDQTPPWLDKERFYRAREIFKNHFFR